MTIGQSCHVDQEHAHDLARLDRAGICVLWTASKRICSFPEPGVERPGRLRGFAAVTIFKGDLNHRSWHSTICGAVMKKSGRPFIRQVRPVASILLQLLIHDDSRGAKPVMRMPRCDLLS
jgi:hypothetical protein